MKKIFFKISDMIENRLIYYRLGKDKQLIKLIKKSIKKTQSGNVRFGGWALSKSALIAFTYECISKQKFNIVEFGGGCSTYFWNAINIQCKQVCTETFEHNREWYDRLKGEIVNNNINIKYAPIRQLGDTERKSMFRQQENALNTWKNSIPVSDSEAKNMRLKNTFYSFTDVDLPTVDAIILDGPHGNGRSLAFPLLYNKIKPGTIILIDDFDHYPFIYDISKLFVFDVLYASNIGKKHWIIIRIEEKR